MNIYAFFLIVKGLLNLGAATAALLVMNDPKMSGFWLALAFADVWIGVWSLS